MLNIFAVKDKSNRIIYLTKERWKHIITEHPVLSNKIENIKEAVINPLVIRKDSYNDKIRYYYLKDKIEKRYLLVIVKYLNGKGHIRTSFYVKNIKK